MDYRPALYGRGGIAVYVREIARALARVHPEDLLDLQAWRLRRGPASADREVDGASRGRALLRTARVPSQVLGVLARLGWGPDRLTPGGADVVHWTDYVAPPPVRAPLVATVHDLLFEELPGCYTAAMRRGLRRATTRLVRTARRFVVPSRRTREALTAGYGVDSARMDVVEEGVGSLLTNTDNSDNYELK
ncbi:MAG: glycosyltransferase, partial [Planctomycetota bacterium]